MNSDNEFDKGVGIRLAGEEYGATTGRTRRTGWTDLIYLNDALRYNKDKHGRRILVLTKPDVLNHANEYRICFAHQVNCKEMKLDGITYRKGDVVNTFIREKKLILG